MNALRTVQIGKGWFPEDAGGLERYYYDLVRSLPASGIPVDGLVTGSAQVVKDSAGSVQAFASSTASVVTRWRGVREHLSRVLSRHPDSLVVAHFALYAAPCLDLIRGGPLLVHFQGPWAAESRAEGESSLVCSVKKRIERAVYDRASRFIVLSRAFGELLHEQHAVPADRIDVIPGGVDCARWSSDLTKAEARAQLGWPSSRPIVLVVRRLVRRMGLEGLIQSVPLIRRAVPDALIMVVGKGPLARELEMCRVAGEVTENLQFVGFVPDDLLPVAYRAADLTVVPSVALEGFGLVVVESLAAGTPVLVTAVGGLPETVEGLSPACIIRGHGPQAVGRAIADALLGQLPLPDASACVRHARDNFDWSVVAARISASYRRTIE